MLSAVRSFFKERSVNEVDCPIISASASVDAHIDLIPAVDAAGQMRYLHSSPEYGMKRLLAEGIGDIYQLSHVFRQGEYGRKHNPEFMMAEWYRVGASFDALMAETVDFVRLFLGDLPSSTISYRQAFKEIAGIDYLHASSQDLFNFLMSREIDIPESLAEEGKDALLNIILGTLIEPHLGKNEILVLAYYPSSQAALAQTRMHHDEPVAERFEIYYQGLELANGYHELANADEQRTRFIAANAERVKMGKLPLPIDENFLQSLQKGLPDCCGVAVGFDRLMMVRHRTSRIANVIPFDWESA
jgi:lysyl-tRNA synthetase class 2